MGFSVDSVLQHGLSVSTALQCLGILAIGYIGFSVVRRTCGAVKSGIGNLSKSYCLQPILGGAMFITGASLGGYGFYNADNPGPALTIDEIKSLASVATTYNIATPEGAKQTSLDTTLFEKLVTSQTEARAARFEASGPYAPSSATAPFMFGGLAMAVVGLFTGVRGSTMWDELPKERRLT